MKNLLILLVVIMCLFSCSELNIQDGNIEQNKSEKNLSKQSLLFNGTTNYSKILHIEKPLVGYSSLKENSLVENEINFINQLPHNNLKNLKLDHSAEGLQVFANGINLTGLDNSSNNRAKLNSVQKSLYGTKVCFKLTRLKSSNTDSMKHNGDTTITMYVPDVVNITSPAIRTSQELFPYCYFKDFIIKWNADGLNENGLVVLLEWYGVSLNEEKENVYTRNVDIIENDNGVAKLNDEIFNNIPHNAIAYITLLRGNVEIIENLLNDESFRLAAESHAILPFILVREL